MTRSIKCAAVIAAWVCFVAFPLSAAPNDFYVSMLQRGINHVKSGNYDQAAKELRIAAFGLVDYVPQFETAQIYETIASEKLGRETDARHAAQRVLAAERIEARYAKLNIPTDVRASFETIVTRILTSDQVAVLHAGSPAPINPQPVAPIVVPTPAPTPTPVPKSPAPITAQPTSPISPIELPSPAPRSEVSPPSVPPRTIQPAPTPAPSPQPRAPQPTVVTPAPAPAPVVVPPPMPILSPRVALTQLGDAEAALGKNDLVTARNIYRVAIQAPTLDHATALRIAEGSYRARDFSTTARAFERVGAIAKGEEPYRYYLAVALYETGKYAAAKRELASALPFIELTRDVARYRAKIEGAIE